jgi:L-alanine-DL-glutamate epimerase-like enolase superfamily enzyme
VKIKRILAYQVDLPLHEGAYKWSGGKSVEVFDSTLVQIETDDGLSGYGEICPLGPAYLPSYANGARAGIRELAPHLIGADPRDLSCINQIMDSALKGHTYAKSAIDIACWDLLGKTSGLPICTLLGGRFGADYGLYRAISQDTPEKMTQRIREYQAEGYRSFQLKVGGVPEVDIERIRQTAKAMRPGDRLIADANTGWLLHDAKRVVNAVRDVDVYIEQPCVSYEECLDVRRHTNLPFVMDECIHDLPTLLRALQDSAMDVVNLKISKLGGLTKARQARDLCVAMGIAMTLEDTWGGDFTTAAITHLAHSTPSAFLFSSTDFNSYVTVQTADNAPRKNNGRIAAPNRPGLGLEPRREVLGKPVIG